MKSALAGLLGLFVIIAAVFSASPLLHCHVHPDTAAGHHVCLICAFAHGQVGTTDTAPDIALVPLRLVHISRPAHISSDSNFEYRYSASRAPPCS